MTRRRGRLLLLLCNQAAFLWTAMAVLVALWSLTAGPHVMTAMAEPLHIPSKHIMFVAGVGTASHLTPYEAIAEELVKRGHIFSWAGFEEAHRWEQGGKLPFVPLGAGTLDRMKDMMVRDNIMEQRSGMNMFFKNMATILPDSYREQYWPLVNILKGETKVVGYRGGKEGEAMDLPTPDLLICDFFAFACIDAAVEYKVPYLMTITGFFMGVGVAPYIMESLDGTPEVSDNLLVRLKSLLSPLRAAYYSRPMIQALDHVRVELNAPPLEGTPMSRWHDVPVLNTGSFFGWDEPRSLDPHVLMVGPIINNHVRQPPPIMGDLKTWLDSTLPSTTNTSSTKDGWGIVYVALGSMAILTPQRAQKLLEGLAQLHASGLIKGAIIANRSDPPRSKEDLVAINVRWEKWAPQAAILAHPATRAFISHGGQESMFEAIYNAVPVVVLPSLGDQFVNGHKIQASGAGDVMDKHTFTSQEVVTKLTHLLLDPTGTVHQSMSHLHTLLTLTSRDTATKAANIIETEMVVGHKHLVTLPRRRGIVRGYNLDLLVGLVVVVVLVLSFVKKVLCGLLGGREEGRRRDSERKKQL